VRYLAPIALAATIAGTVVVVQSSLSGNHASAAHAGHSGGRRGKHATARFYLVQTGDNLTTIATKTGVSILTLEALNPTIDPNSLQTGQRLRLRR
jgi:hypothetical protein